MIKDIINHPYFFIIIDVVLGSLMALLGVMTYGRTKRVSQLLLVFTALALYINMILRVLDELHVFVISEMMIQGVPLLEHIFNYLPMLFMFFAFIAIMADER